MGATVLEGLGTGVEVEVAAGVTLGVRVDVVLRVTAEVRLGATGVVLRKYTMLPLVPMKTSKSKEWSIRSIGFIIKMIVADES
jgi:hypothetical protein